MTRRAFARIVQRLRCPRARELHTSPRPVGGDEAADWAGPDGNQVNATRSPADCSGFQFHYKVHLYGVHLLLQLRPTRWPPAEGMVSCLNNPL
jgi:hypothetical protein